MAERACSNHTLQSEGLPVNRQSKNLITGRCRNIESIHINLNKFSTLSVYLILSFIQERYAFTVGIQGVSQRQFIFATVLEEDCKHWVKAIQESWCVKLYMN